MKNSDLHAWLIAHGVVAAGSQMNPAEFGLLIFSLKFVSALPATVVFDYFGRRPMTLAGLSTMAVCSGMMTSNEPAVTESARAHSYFSVRRCTYSSFNPPLAVRKLAFGCRSLQ